MLKIKHIELKDANDFVSKHHRHHKPVRGHRFSLAAYDGDVLVGVSIVGRPLSREIDSENVVEILRLCTDGTKNACSFLYGASCRAAKSLGYSKIITYILETEDGASLKASNFQYETTTKGGSWSTPSRPRIDKAPICKKQRWGKLLNA